MGRQFDLEAKIRFLSAEEGGRSKPVFSSYRPNHDFGVHDDYGLVDAVHEYVGTDHCDPGQSVFAKLTFLNDQPVLRRLFPGQEFRVQEGARIVAIGSISRLLRADLQA